MLSDGVLVTLSESERLGVGVRVEVAVIENVSDRSSVNVFVPLSDVECDPVELFERLGEREAVADGESVSVLLLLIVALGVALADRLKVCVKLSEISSDGDKLRESLSSSVGESLLFGLSDAVALGVVDVDWLSSSVSVDVRLSLTMAVNDGDPEIDSDSESSREMLWLLLAETSGVNVAVVVLDGVSLHVTVWVSETDALASRVRELLIVSLGLKDNVGVALRDCDSDGVSDCDKLIEGDDVSETVLDRLAEWVRVGDADNVPLRLDDGDTEVVGVTDAEWVLLTLESLLVDADELALSSSDIEGV